MKVVLIVFSLMCLVDLKCLSSPISPEPQHRVLITTAVSVWTGNRQTHKRRERGGEMRYIKFGSRKGGREEGRTTVTSTKSKPQNSI